jgi:CDP-glycerol glycerophosphotransferase (TagB/SpsB family)
MKNEATLTNNLQLTNLKQKLLIQYRQKKNFQILKPQINKILFICLFFFISYITYKNKNKFFKSKDDIENNEDRYISFSNFNVTTINLFNMYQYFNKKYSKLEQANYTYSNKYNITKVDYTIGVYNEEKYLIYPSDLSLYNDVHVTCFLEIQNDTNITEIYSIPDIHNNNYFKCTEFYNISEKVKFGIKIFHKKDSVIIYNEIFLFPDKIKYNFYTENDSLFDNKLVEYEYNTLLDRTKDERYNKTLRFMEYYMNPPICQLKRNAFNDSNDWIFNNIYNNYFCFCVGEKCLRLYAPHLCKYYKYMDIIEHNRHVYPKTDYIFVDFIFKDLSSDDAFPVFEEMEKRNYPVHYITEKKDLIERYCGDDPYCNKIIKVNRALYDYYADFIEKHLTTILKTKAVVSCKENGFHFVSYLFYRLEYITYIAVGHGVCLFKDYLFEKTRIYGNKRNNQIVIPPSKILIEAAVKYGWSEENIIKINLPRWDRYNFEDTRKIYLENYPEEEITSNSILVMFTWRYNRWMEHKDISPFYHENISRILTNETLNEVLENKNMSLYFSFHRYVNKKYKKKYEDIIESRQHIKFISQNDISHVLGKTSLVVSDFSSIIFDLMYRRKPFVIFVPDSNDPNVVDLYTEDYSKLIDDMNHRKFNIANHFFTVEETVEKIIYYINNNFTLDEELLNYYENFGFKKGNNIDTFINYLKSLP